MRRFETSKSEFRIDDGNFEEIKHGCICVRAEVYFNIPCLSLKSAPLSRVHFQNSQQEHLNVTFTFSITLELSINIIYGLS